MEKTGKQQQGDPFGVGASVFVRTVTHHYTGRIVSRNVDELRLVDAAWIADDGRFSTALETGVFSEIEPYPTACEPIAINRGSIVDMCVWPHPLPRTQK